MLLQLLEASRLVVAANAHEARHARVQLEVLPYVGCRQEAARTVRTAVREHAAVHVLVVLEALARPEALLAHGALVGQVGG